MVRELRKSIMQINTLGVGYYLNGSLSTRHVGGYTLARCMFP